MSKSDFEFADLKKEDVTVYLVVPADKMKAFSRWFRLLIATALDELMQAPTPKHRKKPVLLQIDELPILGNMECLETAAALGRGYGLQLHCFAQNYGQLTKLYGPEGAATFLGNCGIQQFFTPNDMITAEYLSRRLGKYTIRAQNKKADDQIYMQPQTARDLASPQEIIDMMQDRQLVFKDGKGDSFLVKKRLWFKDSILKKRGMPDPYHN